MLSKYTLNLVVDMPGAQHVQQYRLDVRQLWKGANQGRLRRRKAVDREGDRTGGVTTSSAE